MYVKQKVLKTKGRLKLLAYFQEPAAAFSLQITVEESHRLTKELNN